MVDKNKIRCRIAFCSSASFYVYFNFLVSNGFNCGITKKTIKVFESVSNELETTNGRKLCFLRYYDTKVWLLICKIDKILQKNHFTP